MDELSTYRSRIGLFAYTAYKKSSQGRKPKQRPSKPGPVTKQTSKRHTTTEVTVEPERRRCTLALVLLLVSVACSIERYGYVSDISYLTSVDWLTGNDTLSLGQSCSFTGNCYYRSTISSKHNLPIRGITGVTSLDSFISDCKQNHLNSSLIYNEVSNYNYTVLNYRDITSTVSEEPVCTVNSCDNYTVLNYRCITSPVSEEPVCTVNSCDNYTVLNYRGITSTVSKEPVCTVNSCDYYTVLNNRNITSPVSEEAVYTVNSCDNYTVLNYKDLTSPLREEPVCTVNSCDNYAVLNYKDLTLPLREEPVCTVNSCDNYTVLNNRNITSPVSEEAVYTVNSCDNYTVLNYKDLTSPLREEPVCTVNSCDNYAVLNYKDLTSPLREEPVCTVNSCDNYAVLNYKDLTLPLREEPVCTVNSCDNYAVLNYKDLTLPLREEPVCTVNSCDNYTVLNYRDLLLPVRDEPPSTIRTCGLGSCLYLLGNECGSSCFGNPNNYTNIWRTLQPSGVSYDSIIDNYESRWVTLQPLGVSCMLERFSYSVLVSENRHQRTCSFLIGNSGSHAYKGNPPLHGGEEEDIKLIHCRMLNRLSDVVYPDIGDAWKKLKNMLSVYLSPKEINDADNIFKIYETLQEKGKVKCGQYGVLKTVFAESGLMNCCKIVDEFSQKIEDTRGKPSFSLPRNRTRDTSPPGTESHADKLLKKMHPSAGEDIRTLHGIVDTLALHAAGLGTSETVYSRGAAAPIQHKMPPVDMELYVENWKKEDKLCYVTTGIKHVVQTISCDEVCFHCVVGVPASGKSTAIRHAALHLKGNLGFNIYVITKPKEFFTYLDKGIKQIFLQEDLIGQHFVDKEMLRSWDKYNDRIKSCLDKNTKFLSSLRAQLYLDQELKGKNYIFNSKHHITNLSDKIFKLNVSEMKNMLRHYLKVYKVANIEVLIEKIWPQRTWFRLSESTKGHDFDKYFPLICRVFSENESVRVDPEKYFRDPLPVLQNVLQQIKNNNKPQFCGLLLCGITELKDEHFSPLCELNKPPHFNSIIESLDLDPKKDLLKIKEALQTLEGVYISHIGNRYTFLHVIFQNTVTYLYDDKYYVFKYATRDFIISRVRLFAKLATDDEYVLVYGEECADLLVSRMIHELKSIDDTLEAARFIVYNCNIDNETLISRLVTQLYDHHDVSITQRMTDDLFHVSVLAVCNYTLLHPHTDVTSCPQYQLLASLITRHDCSRRLVWMEWWTYPVLLSVYRGVLPVTKLLLTKPEVSLDVSDDDNRCVLHQAVKCYNNVDMTKYLLSLPNLKCLNHRDKWGYTPYWCAVNKSYVEHRQELIELYKDNGAIL